MRVKPAVWYEWEVSAEVDTPLEPGRYLIRIVEGGTYRSLASRRKYTIREVDREKETIRYEYVRGEGETVERTGDPQSLAVVEAVGDTLEAVIESPEVRR